MSSRIQDRFEGARRRDREHELGREPRVGAAPRQAHQKGRVGSRLDEWHAVLQILAEAAERGERIGAGIACGLAHLAILELAHHERVADIIVAFQPWSTASLTAAKIRQMPTPIVVVAAARSQRQSAPREEDHARRRT